MRNEELLEKADRLARSSGAGTWQALMLVLLEELSNLELPSDVTPAFSAAERYWSRDQQDKDTLLEAKELCWSFLNDLVPPDLSHPDGKRVRALLCVLESDGDQEAATDTAEWFAEMLQEDPADPPRFT